MIDDYAIECFTDESVVADESLECEAPASLLIALEV